MRLWHLPQLAVLASLATSASIASAQTRSQVYGGRLTQEAQTFYVRGDEEITTYDSKAAASKETRPSTSLTVGGWAGEARTVGVSLTSSDATVPFSLNNSHMSTSFRDVRFMARLGWLIPSVGVSLSEVNVSRDGTQTVGLYGTGANAGLALAIPVGRLMVFTADAMAVHTGQIYDKLGQGAKLGQRLDGDVSASFDVTDKLVDLLIGYRYRSYEISSADAKYSEQAQGAYAGLRLGLYF